MIKPNQRNEIIRTIFKANRNEFDRLIDELETVQDWRTALKKVEEKCRKYGFYLYDREVLLFTDILYNRYFPEEDQVQIF